MYNNNINIKTVSWLPPIPDFGFMTITGLLIGGYGQKERKTEAAPAGAMGSPGSILSTDKMPIFHRVYYYKVRTNC